jgi:subtilase family serine protease
VKTLEDQSGISSIVGTKRGTPDISLDGNPSSGVAEYNSLPYLGSVLNWLQIGGTSVSSPTLAGIINAAGGFSASTNAALTKYYNEYANANQYAKAWRDIKTGATSCKVGWDICDGIGSPVTYKGK